MFKGHRNIMADVVNADHVFDCILDLNGLNNEQEF